MNIKNVLVLQFYIEVLIIILLFKQMNYGN